MIPTLAFFYVLMIGPGQAAVAGPFADYASCAANATYVEYWYGQADHLEDGYGVASACYQAAVPGPDDTPELGRDDRI